MPNPGRLVRAVLVGAFVAVAQPALAKTTLTMS